MQMLAQYQYSDYQILTQKKTMLIEQINNLLLHDSMYVDKLTLFWEGFSAIFKNFALTFYSNLASKTV